MNTKPEFVENLDDCTLHCGADMLSLTITPPYGQKIGLGMREKIVRACESHEELVAALQNAVNVLAGIATGDLKTVYPSSPAIEQARAALDKAKGNRL